MLQTRTNTSDMRGNSKTFFFASCLLPENIRDEIRILYRFCRYVDDTVDLSNDYVQAKQELFELRNDIEQGNSQNSIVFDILKLIDAGSLRKSHILLLLNGMEKDLKEVRVESYEELISYAYQVASSVGLMFCDLIEVDDEELRSYACDLGLAMQITNITRDLVEDYENGRIYFPNELVSHRSIEAALEKGDEKCRDEVFDCIRILLAEAARHYRRSELGIGGLPLKVRWAVKTAAVSYEAIGQLILEKPESYWQKRARTSLFRKLLLSLSSFVDVYIKDSIPIFSPKRKLEEKTS